MRRSLQQLYHYFSGNIKMLTLDQVSLQAEYELIFHTLIETEFNKTKAAEKLGIDRKTLYNKLEQIKKLKGLKKPKVVFA